MKFAVNVFLMVLASVIFVAFAQAEAKIKKMAIETEVLEGSQFSVEKLFLVAEKQWAIYYEHRWEGNGQVQLTGLGDNKNKREIINLGKIPAGKIVKFNKLAKKINCPFRVK
ncbi:MAG: hypothetical protein ABIE43_01850 [Patescibacteria group bacterium]